MTDDDGAIGQHELNVFAQKRTVFPAPAFLSGGEEKRPFGELPPAGPGRESNAPGLLEQRSVTAGGHGTATRGTSSDDTILVVGLVGIGLTVLAFPFDKAIKNDSQEERPLKRSAGLGNNILGVGYVHVALGGGMLAAGGLFHSEKLAATGSVALEALLINGVATEGLKYAVGRQRPNGSSQKMSFPSGHTSSTAAFAASVSAMYNWNPVISVPLFATVAFVGASRIDSNQHYLSDVIAGLTLGTIIGMTVAKRHKRDEAAAAGLDDTEENKDNSKEERLFITPIYQDGTKGLLLTFKY